MNTHTNWRDVAAAVAIYCTIALAAIVAHAWVSAGMGS